MVPCDTRRQQGQTRLHVRQCMHALAACQAWPRDGESMGGPSSLQMAPSSSTAGLPSRRPEVVCDKWFRDRSPLLCMSSPAVHQVYGTGCMVRVQTFCLALPASSATSSTPCLTSMPIKCSTILGRYEARLRAVLPTDFHEHASLPPLQIRRSDAS